MVGASMPRRLKTYQTSIGFFDLAIGAPSMKAAAEAWGSDTDVFKKGFAKETDDPEIVADDDEDDGPTAGSVPSLQNHSSKQKMG